MLFEFYKEDNEHNRNLYNGSGRNPYHIFITMLYTFYNIIESINEEANCLIITEYINGFFPLVILELFFKCFEKVEFIEYSKLNLYPIYAFDFPIKLYGFKKEKTEWFLKKCEALMKKYPFEYTGCPKDKTVPKYSKVLENKIIKFNHTEQTLLYESLLKIENDIELNLINQENNLREAVLLCQKYELPLKKWVPEKKFGEDIYGIHLLSTMYSLDNSIIFKFNKEDDNFITALTTDFDKSYNSLIHKIDLVGIPIEYADIGKWYDFNRTYRWYEKTLVKDLKERFNLHVYGRAVSRAWVKMFEILKLFNFKSNNETVKTFHVCEAPGMMMKAMNYYITTVLKKKHSWKGQSLAWIGNSGKRPKIWDGYKMIERMPEGWNFGPKNTGDIMDIDNILYYREKYGNTKIEWFSGDCGDEFAAKDKTPRLHFAELLSMMLILGNGGNFVSKLYFPINDDKMMEILYIVYKQFNEFCFYKSYQNPWNTEVYVIGKGYKYDVNVVNELITHYKNDTLKLNKCTASFKLQMFNFTEKLYYVFSEAINRHLYFIDHIHDIPDNLLKDLVVKRNNEWIEKFM